jgi:methylated-DNA-[protein]-cysteine S-methyltransferase
MAVDTAPARLLLDRLATPIGELLLVTDEHGVLRALDYEDYEPRMRQLLQRHYGAAETAPGGAPGSVREALDAYFAGDLDSLAGIAWATAGTPFQRAVWAALPGIPPRATLSYGALAARLGVPRAVRAVGLANGANPIAIVVPCHRVIGANGALTGYGGGLHRKRWLLAHEGAAAEIPLLDRAPSPRR